MPDSFDPCQSPLFTSESQKESQDGFLGNSQALADFLDKHQGELSRFIVRKLGSDEQVSDFLQDAYLRLRTHENDEAIRNPRAFVFRVIANLIVDFQRRSVNRLQHENDDEVWQDVADKLPGPEQLYQRRQRLDAIHDALTELPWQCRQAFFLNRVEGCSHAEVAGRLGISESMVAKHLVRAMTHCREKLKHY